ncbi:hypothetical protein A2276_02195 [candidate division WOR-1 bacterium RIFOXYA12_FULL_43_27]|uniref:Ferrous iron transporter FeoA-like domain-containing protein n=1 Tax=candidate division WOR-1 bacterium RIFOXYC2_FULL_46_14 TaxID=1802587 RepID=A0A1F4U846_UNCSA|nr:MAG: hypothetical protein A2276_02195 [candidate division WOR-1 bacterium RIFOXYA12_FULL_43_27]OGC19470.1 MAG: hypothetical protein A2292_02135 [candidate division WOR-1 bacterium RIFOXYB2_FULL_46_45]OGC30458.1 MAG: hypothetical protein A2232_02135 [candidate division WOR-1 bacterium RIFOXYA2_FULL_46_56]OGC41057.1 MAG: hypothetical protein A2438_02130 [candidate division WOR-1 bacterium RIFOXYC2_FULL_46_14]
MERKKILLTELPAGKVGIVSGFAAGFNSEKRLSALGLQAGKQIKRLSGIRWGPITVQIGSTQVSLGRGMASKIIVEVSE